MKEIEKITIFDTTLRDGEQSPGCSMNLDEKIRIARQLENLGVDIIEAGFPIASEGDFQAVQAIAEELPETKIAAFVPDDRNRYLPRRRSPEKRQTSANSHFCRDFRHSSRI